MEIPSEAIEKIRNLSKPAIIAISGFGGSGKSTAAHQIAEVLSAPVISVDEFGIDRNIENYTNWEGMDFKRLEAEVLVPFLHGENPIRYGRWSHGPNKIVKMAEVPHQGALVIEGVGLFRPEVSKCYAYKIWINCPQDIANARGKKRDREVHKNPRTKNGMEIGNETTRNISIRTSQKSRPTR